MIAQALSQPRRSRLGFQLAISIVAIALVALAVGTLLLVGGAVTQHPAGKSAPTVAPNQVPTQQAAPTPGPSRLTEPLPIPTDQGVILYTDPADPTQLDGVTWDGATRGRVQTNQPLVGARGPAGNPHVHSAQGPFIANTAGIHLWDESIWADDRQHICVMSHASAQPPPQGEPTTLKFGLWGSSLHTVVQVGTVHEQNSVRPEACSVKNDMAVVVQSAGQSVSDAQYWVVQLSTGRILGTHIFQPGGIQAAKVRASWDARYIAVVQTLCCQQPPTPASTTIFSSDGTQLAQVPGYLWDFSLDGSLAVVTMGNVAQVVRWQDGAVLWRGPTGGAYVASFPEPSGHRMAVVVSHPGDPQHGDLWVVGPDGSAQRLVTDPGA